MPIREPLFFSVALFIHGSVAFALWKMPVASRLKAPPIEVEMKAQPPPVPALPPLTPPEPPTPEPPKKIVTRRALPPSTTPPPSAPPPSEPPPEPTPPRFGATMESTTESSSFAVPTGNTTMTQPKSGPATASTRPLAPRAAAAKPAYQPASELSVRSLPEIDSEACGRSVRYPPEAEQLGIEGTVQLRVALDESGRVHDVAVTSGLGHGLDEAAIQALRHKCKFRPALDSSGKPVAYVIQSYKFRFELPR
jgi:protein TonB